MHDGANKSTSTGDLFASCSSGPEKGNSSNVKHDFFGFVGVMAPECTCSYWHENADCEYCKCNPFQQPDWHDEQRESDSTSPYCLDCNDDPQALCFDCKEFHRTVACMLRPSVEQEQDRARSERLSRAVELGRSPNLFDDQYTYEWDDE